MKLMRSSIQRFNICAITYFIYVCFFYEKDLFGGVFFQISKILIWIFIAVLIFESLRAGYCEQILFIILTYTILTIFYCIGAYISSATIWGYGLYELERTLFLLPLNSMTMFSTVTFIFISIISFIFGFACKLIKKTIHVTKEGNDVINVKAPFK